MPASGWAGMPHNPSDEAGDGRYRSYLVTTTAAKPAAASGSGLVHRARPSPDLAAAVDRRVLDVPAVDPDHRLPGGLSGAVLDLSIDAEQGANALHRARQFQLPVVTRRVLDGGSAVRHLRADRGILQSADRSDHRASDQQ